MPPPNTRDEDDRDTWDDEQLERLREDRTWVLLEKYAENGQATRGSLQAIDSNLSSLERKVGRLIEALTNHAQSCELARSHEETPTSTPSWLRAWSSAWQSLREMEWWRLILLSIIALAFISCFGVFSTQLSTLLSAVR